VLLEGKTAIRQLSVPGVPGARPFCDSLDAAKVSNLVREKIRMRKSPAVSPNEIDSLQIRIKC